LPVLMFGLIFGNLFVGVPFYFDPISMRSFYEGNFLSLLNPMGIVAALTSLFMILMHGTAYLNRRTTSGLQNHFRQLQLNFSMVFLILFTVCGLLLMYKVNGFTLVHSPANAPAHALSNVVTRGVGVWYQNMNLHPWKWAGPIMVYVAALLSLLTMRLGNGGLSFWLSGTAVAGTVMSAGFALFPFIEPSSAMPDQSITMWNATSSPLNLMGMLYVGGVMLVIIFAYKFWGYSRVWGKQKTLSVKDIEADDHTFY
jgi:cytochrome d ubiquinol oxidase subunit II